jgi:hypothetical protein
MTYQSHHASQQKQVLGGYDNMNNQRLRESQL